jgi:transposase
MAKRHRLSFSQDDMQLLVRERYEHPEPRVQQRMEVLWLISQGRTHQEAANLASVSRATAERYVAIYRRGGVAALRQFRWCKPVSALEEHRDTLEESFRKNPPHTVAEACARIKTETGLERRPTQVRAFLKSLGPEMALRRRHSVTAQEDRGRTRRHAGRVLAAEAGTGFSGG